MNKRWTHTLATALGALAFSSAVNAQDTGGDADIELGATQAGSVELGAGSGSSSSSASSAGGYKAGGPSGGYSGGSSSSGGVRLALQLRLDAINLIAMAEPDGLDTGPLPSRQLLVPVATPGVRLLDEGALFLGLGLGFANASSDNGPNEQSQTGFSLTPLVTYDVIAESDAALSLLAMLDLASLGETEQCNAAGCMDQNDDAFGIGLGVGAGLRGKLSPSVALGGEFGWGFLSVDRDGADDSDFVHGIFANLLLEASIEL